MACDHASTVQALLTIRGTTHLVEHATVATTVQPPSADKLAYWLDAGWRIVQASSVGTEGYLLSLILLEREVPTRNE